MKSTPDAATWAEPRNAMSGSKIVLDLPQCGTRVAYPAASMNAVKTCETGTTTDAAPKAGASSFMSMQIVEGDADFGTDPMLAVIGGMAEFNASQGAVKCRQG
jgi:hypothetical protein